MAKDKMILVEYTCNHVAKVGSKAVMAGTRKEVDEVTALKLEKHNVAFDVEKRKKEAENKDAE